jgi:hypothetical protein
MTTRTFTPRPAQPAAKTTATGAMDGWRIEVAPCDALKVDIAKHYRESCANVPVHQPSGEIVGVEVHQLVLAPQRAGIGSPLRYVHACVDPLFETIYVSRALEGDEPDTLRRLMAEECGRERREAVKTDESFSCDLIATLSGTGGSGMYEDLARDLNAALGIGDEPIGTFDRVHSGTIPGHPGGVGLVKTLDGSAGHRVTFAVYDGMRHWSCPKCKMMLADRAIESHAFKCACGFSSDPASAPRVPKVGEEIEVRDGDTWSRRRVERFGTTSGDAEWFYVERRPGERYAAGRHPRSEGNLWRWPEQAKREAPTKVPIDLAVGQGTWVALAADKSAAYSCTCGRSNALASSCPGQGVYFACSCKRCYRASWSSEKLYIHRTA